VPRNARGFTLVELVIIILLVAVLASTAVIKLSGSLETAKVEATRRNWKRLHMQLPECGVV